MIYIILSQRAVKNVMYRRDRRRSALFFAVDNDSEDAAEMLLEAGAQTDGLDYISVRLNVHHYFLLITFEHLKMNSRN